MELFTDVSKIVLFVGVMAFLVSGIAEVLKRIPWLNKVPTALTVLCVSLILCPLSMLTMYAYFKLVIAWYMIAASFVIAFVVALVAMDGWERVTELAKRMIKK